jgi:hypothetical protein
MLGDVKRCVGPRIAVLRERKFSFLHQSQTNCDEICFVDREHLNRGEADVGLGGQNGAVPFEMFAPTIISRVKKTDDIAGRRVPPGNVRPFMPVAVETCERKVVCISEAAVLSGNDVINVKWQWVSRGGQVAVFATAPCPPPDLPRKFGIHDLSTAKGDSGLCLNHREQIAHMQVAVEFGALFLCQLPGLRSFGQAPHAIDVALRKSDREQILRGRR